MIFLPVLSFFLGGFPTSVSDGSVSAVESEHIQVYPAGDTVGICLYSKGLLVTGDSPITDMNGKQIRPAIDAGIKKGDLITFADGADASCVEAFSSSIKASRGDIRLTVQRGDKSFEVSVSPVRTSSGSKIGLWVRDSTAGIGTVTYYNPSDSSLGVLGHGIADVDTGNILSVKKGNILPCLVNAPTKGEKGSPGELNGSFDSKKIGIIEKNTVRGVFGRADNPELLTLPELMPVAHRDEISEGEAYILANVDGGGVRSYRVDIKKYSPSRKDGKNFVLKVCDSDLIEKTGGIIQGMSGSPIIQNNMLVGAVTHVFVNDPKKGYGILAESMLCPDV